MTPLPERTAKELFLDALDLDEAERSRFLSEACSGDPSLRASVMELLEAHADAGPFMAGSTPFDTLQATTDRNARGGKRRSDSEDVGPGDRIGDFTLIRGIGEGGFGTVYLAEQTEPISRQVAIKVLKSGFECESVLERFHRERQALASMDHPGIARILDAGSLETRQPYFVMEYVDGSSLIDYCDKKQLDLRARLALFQQICFAVRHAHQRGIIHRDLKPNNLLIAENDGRPTCRVIDFGIARAVTQDEEDPQLTIEHQLVGTPQYMSPEQASGNNADLDTRTDIYSLGVILYELLTGVTPFDAAILRKAGPVGILQILRDDDPPVPSSRLRTLATRDAAASEARAELRGLAARALRRRLRGELDGLVMKALDRDRERRYPTADALANDIQRFLDGRPLVATSYGPTRLLLKATRRHWLAATAVGALVIGLAAGLFGALIGARRAEQSAQQAMAVNEFFGDVLGRSDPTAGGGDVTLIDALRFAAATIPDRFAKFPEQEILARGLVGSVFLAQTMHREAKGTLEPGYRMAQERFGMADDRTLKIGMDLLSSLGTGGRIEEIESVGKPLAEALLTHRGANHRETIEARRLLAVAFIRRGAWPEAIKRTRTVLQDARKALGPTDRITIRTTVDLAQSLKGLSTHESMAEAIALLQPVVDLEASSRASSSDPDRPGTAFPNGQGYSRDAMDTAYMLGYLRMSVGQVDLAIRIFRDILARAEGRISESHSLLAETRLQLATALLAVDQTEEAGPLAVVGVEALRKRSGDEHPTTLSWMTRALPMLLHSDEVGQGEVYSRILYERFRGLGLGQSNYAFVFGVTHARFLVKTGALEEAEALLDELAPFANDKFADHVRAVYHLNRGELLLTRDKLSAAEAALRRGLDLLRSSDQKELERNEIDLLSALIECLDRQGRNDEATLLNQDLLSAKDRMMAIGSPD